jgi:hypothetical protein
MHSSGLDVIVIFTTSEAAFTYYITKYSISRRKDYPFINDRNFLQETPQSSIHDHLNLKLESHLVKRILMEYLNKTSLKRLTYLAYVLVFYDLLIKL